ncbi:MAG: DUF4430 domain-containing protein [Clostridia bacterium]
MKNKKLLLGIGCLVLVAALLFGAYTLWMPKGSAGAKQITLQVVGVDKQSKDFSISTDQAYLRGALEEQKLIAGEESQYGLFVKTVDGYTVDEGKQEWWCVTKGGAEVTTGVDTTPIADGDHFELTLSKW